jgi:hypothetical protein
MKMEREIVRRVMETMRRNKWFKSRCDEPKEKDEVKAHPWCAP